MEAAARRRRHGEALRRCKVLEEAPGEVVREGEVKVAAEVREAV